MPEWSSPFSTRASADQVLADVDLAGRVAVVTGANSGIGLETARALASRGARVVLACRSVERATAAAASIRKRHPEAAVDVQELDLASLANVRAAAAALASSLADSGLHMLVANAGLFATAYRETADGFESTFGVCHLGHFLLVEELMPLLAASAARIVLVSSEAHRQIRELDWNLVPPPRDRYGSMTAYALAKLCNVLHVRELQRRYGERGVLAVALHPGNLVPTGIGRDSILLNLMIQLIRPFTKSLNQGAATSVLCAAHPAVAGFGGAYFSDLQLRQPSRVARQEGVAEELWRRSMSWVAEGRRSEAER